MDQRLRRKLFDQLKRDTLTGVDLSLKGSIDEPIRPLVEIINNNEFYYTTSTCSGRITLIEKPLGKSGIKKGNKFLFSKHELIQYEGIKEIISSYVRSCDTIDDGCERSCLWFKFEPFIMHIQCYDLEKARALLNLGIAAGCRNSGITIGKSEKFMLALRSTSSMEAPVYCNSKFTAQDEYIEFLCDESNRRMSDNLKRLSNVEESIKHHLEAPGGEV